MHHVAFPEELLVLHVMMLGEPGTQMPALRFLYSRYDNMGKLKSRLADELGLPVAAMEISLNGRVQHDKMMMV